MPAPPRQALLVFKIACQKESPLDYNIVFFRSLFKNKIKRLKLKPRTLTCVYLRTHTSR